MFDVIALGELNNDYIFTGLGSMPQPGKEIIAENFTLTLGSSTAITASQCAKLNLKTAFCSLVGDDMNGRLASEFLKRNGVDPRYVKTDGSVSTGITVSISDERDRAMVTYKGAMDGFCAKHFSFEIIKTTRHIHVGSFFLQTALRNDLTELFSRAHEAGVTTSLDAGWDDTGVWDYGLSELLKCTDVFFPNETEAANITGESEPEKAAAKLGAKISVVKCGSAGSVAYSNGKIYKMDIIKAAAVDTTGAGDCFNGGFIYAMLNGKDIGECLAYGNACGSVCVTRIGGASSCASLEDAEARIKK